MATLKEKFNDDDVVTNAIRTGGHADPAGHNRGGQTFTTTAAYSLTKFRAKLYRIGTPGTVYFFLRATAGGVPVDDAGLGYGSIDGDTVTTNVNGEWVDLTLNTPVEVSNDTMYAFEVYSWFGDASNILNFRAYTPSGYATGTRVKSVAGPANWTTTTTYDCLFEVWCGGNDYDEGELDVADTATVDITGETAVYDEGFLAVSDAASVDITGEVYKDTSTYPEGRPTDYDPDETWDETTATWSATYVSVVQNRTLYFVAIGEQGEIYFNEDSGV